jgi:hypothetical protein
VFGSVDPANDPDWTPNSTTTATVLSGPSVIETMLDNCAWMGQQPTNGPTTRALFSRLKAIMGQGLTYQAKEDGSATMGLDTVSMRGGLNGKVCKIYWDDDIPSGAMPLFDLDVTHLKKSTLHFMDTKSPVMPDSGLNIIVAEVGYVLSSFIFSSELRRVHGGWYNGALSA